MHEDLSDLLQEYLEGTMDQLEKIVLEEHLSACPDCRRLLEQFRLLECELRSRPAVEVPVELALLRRVAVEQHLARSFADNRPSMAKDLIQLHLQIFRYSASHIGYNPLNRSLNRVAKKTFSILGKAAGTHLKKRNPLLGRLITA